MGIIPSQMKVIEGLLQPGMQVLTIGRMSVHPVYLPHHRANPDPQYFDQVAAAKFPDIQVDHLDGSAYQGARIIQDMNLPLSDENRALAGSYDLVIDGGSLEHFFDVPQALRNYAALLKTGGKVYIVTNANNHFGHGFYQFSSDLFYRAFSVENGFRVLDCFLETHPTIAAELSPRRQFFDAPDPMQAGQRTSFINTRPVLIHCLAEKTAEAEIVRSVIQSDYQARWGEGEGQVAPPSKIRAIAKSAFDAVPILWRLHDWWKMRHSLKLGRNRSFRRRR
jgi:SAM-dependent methyltransferase